MFSSETMSWKHNPIVKLWKAVRQSSSVGRVGARGALSEKVRGTLVLTTTMCTLSAMEEQK